MLNRNILLFLLTLIFLLTPYPKLLPSTRLDESQQKIGTIKGKVIDAEVKSPIPRVSVKITGLGIETETDNDGNFTFLEVPVGHYILEFSSPFYISLKKPDIIVKSQRCTWVQAELPLSPSLREEVEIEVTAGYFSPLEKQKISSSNFSFEEIRRQAVPAGDISRILSTLPSVVSVNDMKNSLAVRGGSPSENAFYIDDIRVPNINHYPQLGSSAGAIGLINIDFIQEVDFFSGGFQAQYGDSLSSIIDIRFREGNREKHNFQFGLDMMGISAVGEGPIGNSKGSWMFSARRSYLDLLIKLMGQGVPVKYSDFQGKINLNLSSSSRVSFLGIAGIDQSGTEKEDALKDNESYYGSLDTGQYTAGVNWLTMWGSKGYSNISLSQSYIKYKDDFYHTVTENLVRQGENLEKKLTLRNINQFRLNKTNEICFGFELSYLSHDYSYFLASSTDILGRPISGLSRKEKVNENIYAAWLGWSWRLFSLLELNAGLRVSSYSFNENLYLSPRISLAYKLADKSSIKASAGIFRQHLPLHLLHQATETKSIKNPLSYHFILGFSHLFTEDTRLNIEIYDKEYYFFPMDQDQASLFIFDEIFYQGFFSEHKNLVFSGRGRAYGLEAMVQKKLADKLYGIISSSYFRTCYRGLDEVWRNRAYDNHLIFSIQGGYKFNRNWEFSLKWIYAGGYPYTPFDIEASIRVNSGVYDQTRINTVRLPDYHSLNIRLDKRFYFGKTNLILYLTIWNVYNRENVISYYWNTITKEPAQVKLWGILPCFGLEYEF